MSRGHDGELVPEPSTRRTRPVARPTTERAGSDLAALQQAAGNRALAQMLEPEISDRIAAAMGSGTSLESEVAPDQAAALRLSQGTGATDVRLHQDPEAAELSQRLGAVAFTFGRDIFLAADAPALESDAGRRVLRHELTHVRQGGSSGTSSPRKVSSPSSPAEREATHVADHAATHPIGSGTSPATVHRQEDAEEEETVMTMAVDTVHRQEAPEEEQAAEVAEASAEPAADAVVAPQNAALAALFDATVLAKHRAAVDHLNQDPPAPELAQAALSSALDALEPLSDTYEGQDPLLFAQLRRYGNALDRANEQLVAIVFGPRSPEALRDSTLANPAFLGFAEGLRDQLH